MGKRSVHAQGFDQVFDPVGLLGLPVALKAEAAGLGSLLWVIQMTDPRCWRTAAPSEWQSACGPKGPHQQKSADSKPMDQLIQQLN